VSNAPALLKRSGIPTAISPSIDRNYAKPNVACRRHGSVSTCSPNAHPLNHAHQTNLTAQLGFVAIFARILAATNTYNRMGIYLDAYFAVCRKAGYRCNGRDRLEVTRAAQRFFYELGFPRPLPGAAPDIALHVFSYLYLMHNVSTWVCLAKYTGRAGLNFNPGSYDRMNLGAAQLYDRKVEAFDMPSFAQSLAVVTAWRHDLLNLRLVELSREASGTE
jgi:hypothetical protein